MQRISTVVNLPLLTVTIFIKEFKPRLLTLAAEYQSKDGKQNILYVLTYLKCIRRKHIKCNTHHS